MKIDSAAVCVQGVVSVGARCFLALLVLARFFFSNLDAIFCLGSQLAALVFKELLKEFS